mmetsp:Transcript_8335/g.16991  ORF Transcript_8335/g.16991 Transcript_8335/m.16991 type:complete len:430 (+) Transcript_8335:681-1970(+)
MGFRGEGGGTGGEPGGDGSEAFEDGSGGSGRVVVVVIVVGRGKVSVVFGKGPSVTGFGQFSSGGGTDFGLLGDVEISVDAGESREGSRRAGGTVRRSGRGRGGGAVETVHFEHLRPHVQRVAAVAPLDQAGVALSDGIALFVSQQFSLVASVASVAMPPSNNVVNVPPIMLLFRLLVVAALVVRRRVDPHQIGQLGHVEDVLAFRLFFRQREQLHPSRGTIQRRFLLLLFLLFFCLDDGPFVIVVAVAVEAEGLIHRPRGGFDGGRSRSSRRHGGGAASRAAADDAVVSVEFVVVGRIVIVVSEERGAFAFVRLGGVFVLIFVAAVQVSLRVLFLAAHLVAVIFVVLRGRSRSGRRCLACVPPSVRVLPAFPTRRLIVLLLGTTASGIGPCRVSTSRALVGRGRRRRVAVLSKEAGVFAVGGCHGADGW